MAVLTDAQYLQTIKALILRDRLAVAGAAVAAAAAGLFIPGADDLLPSVAPAKFGVAVAAVILLAFAAALYGWVWWTLSSAGTKFRREAECSPAPIFASVAPGDEDAEIIGDTDFLDGRMPVENDEDRPWG